MGKRKITTNKPKNYKKTPQKKQLESLQGELLEKLDFIVEMHKLQGNMIADLQCVIIESRQNL